MRTATHPGEILREEFLPAKGHSISEAAKIIGIPVEQLEALLKEEAPVTPYLAQKIAKYVGTSIEMWMNLQASYDETR